jgi:hypothetical protein
LRVRTYGIIDLRDRVPPRTEDEVARRRRVYAACCEVYREEEAVRLAQQKERQRERKLRQERIRKAEEKRLRELGGK